jgi:hypothetical protein
MSKEILTIDGGETSGINTNPIRIMKFILRGKEQSALKRARLLQQELQELTEVLKTEMRKPSRACGRRTLQAIAGALNVSLTDGPVAQPSPTLTVNQASSPNSAQRDAQWEQALAACQAHPSGEESQTCLGWQYSSPNNVHPI